MSACRRNGQSCGVIFLDIKNRPIIRFFVKLWPKMIGLPPSLMTLWCDSQLPPAATEKLRHHIDAEAASRQMAYQLTWSTSWRSYTPVLGSQLSKVPESLKRGLALAQGHALLMYFSTYYSQRSSMWFMINWKMQGSWRNYIGVGQRITRSQSGDRERSNSISGRNSLGRWFGSIHSPCWRSTACWESSNHMQASFQWLAWNMACSLTFAKGKTEILTSLRGKGAVSLRRHWFTEQGGVLPIPRMSSTWVSCEAGCTVSPS